jgi:HK97 gp10 family phage protein
MPDSATLEWAGMNELAASMKALSREVQDHLAYRAAYGAARNVVKSAQANIVSYGLVDTGALIGNVATARMPPAGLSFSYQIGVRHGTRRQRKEQDDPYYWWWLEFGTVKRPGTPFLTVAFEQEKTHSLDIMAAVLSNGIPRALAKAGA